MMIRVLLLYIDDYLFEQGSCHVEHFDKKLELFLYNMFQFTILELKLEDSFSNSKMFETAIISSHKCNLEILVLEQTISFRIKVEFFLCIFFCFPLSLFRIWNHCWKTSLEKYIHILNATKLHFGSKRSVDSETAYYFPYNIIIEYNPERRV
jgi:hypothetical protein